MANICPCRDQGCGCTKQLKEGEIRCDPCAHGEHIEQAELNKEEGTISRIFLNMEGDKTEITLRGPYLQRKDIDSDEMEGYFFLDVACERVHGEDENIVLTFTREHALQLFNMLAEGLMKTPKN